MGNFLNVIKSSRKITHHDVQTANRGTRLFLLFVYIVSSKTWHGVNYELSQVKVIFILASL